MPLPNWLDWVRRLQSIAQAGKTYNNDVYDQERYDHVRQIAAEIGEAYTDKSAEKIEYLYKHETGYATPKVDVRGVVFNDQKEVLLVLERSSDKWTLPGGWADIWDTPKQAVEREIREESGYDTQAIRLLALYDRDNQGHPHYEFAVYKLYFLCELQGGTAETSIETSDVAFFAENALPPIDEGRVLKSQLHKFFQMMRDDVQITDFD